jgi:hypothetical protein
MVFIKDIWKYFFEEDISQHGENVYLDPETSLIYFEEYEYGIKIPRIFSRLGMLKQYIANYIATSDDKKFKRDFENVPDDILLEYFHIKCFPQYYFIKGEEPYYDHSKWLIWSKNTIFDYIEQWCYENNIKCSKKYTGFETFFEKCGYLYYAI